MMIEPKMRLIPGISPKEEWLYLANETYRGEKASVRSIKNIAKEAKYISTLSQSIYKQADDELKHTKMYHTLLKHDAGSGSGYPVKLFDYIDKMELLTLKVYAVQALLEGYALGALKYRLSIFNETPSYKIDVEILLDELNHISLPIRFLKKLKEQEGKIEIDRFHKVAKDVNRIFSQSFSGERISNIIKVDYNLNVKPDVINNSAGMAEFKRQSISTVLETKSHFLKHYES